MKLAVIGVGLIGGSFALALKKAKAVSHVVGVGRSQQNLELARSGGSTKRDVIGAARKALGAGIARFVPAHPIAGAEKSGAAAASAELFQNRRVVLTPLEENSAEAVSVVEKAWAGCGARLSHMHADEHD